MRAVLLALLATLPLSTVSATAQEAAAVRETRCWLGSVTFSSGASIYAGDGVAVCEGEGGWRETEGRDAAAGCLLEGELSSPGAVVGISNNDRLSLQCGEDGRWVAIDSIEN